MTNDIHAKRALAFLFILLAAALQSTVAQTATYGPHLWDKPLDPAIFEKRVNEQLDLARKAVDQILAVKGPRTIENTLVPYDDAPMVKKFIVAAEEGEFTRPKAHAPSRS